jgi:hypothetical protein
VLHSLGDNDYTVRQELTMNVANVRDHNVLLHRAG